MSLQFVPPSDEEKETVVKLKAQLAAENITYPFTDVAILRFLRGRKHIVEKALNGMQKHLEWRKELKVEELLKDTTSFNHELSQRKFFNSGYDKLGRPIIAIITRKHDKNKRILEDLRSYIIYVLECAIKQSRPEDEKIVLLFDLSKFGLACMDYDAVKLIVDVLQYNYPETLGMALIVGAPMLFSACWAVIKPWLDPVTAAKCVFVKSHQLTDHIDLDQIATEVGDGSGGGESRHPTRPHSSSDLEVLVSKPAAGQIDQIDATAVAAALATGDEGGLASEKRAAGRSSTEGREEQTRTDTSDTSVGGSATVFDTKKMKEGLESADK